MSVYIRSIVECGESETYDIGNFAGDCLDDEGNFVLDGLIVHNSIPDAVRNRDSGTEDWREDLKKLHEDFAAVLGDTYGVIVFQEQLATLWQRIAGFTAPEAQDARKAVAKKWKHLLKPIRQKWIDGASRSIGREEAEKWWDRMETFGRYAFNKCLDEDTILVDSSTGESKTVAQWYAQGPPSTMFSWDGERLFHDQCVTIHDNGDQEVFEVTFDDGTVERVTMQHRFMCSDMEFHTVEEIINLGLDVFDSGAGRRRQPPKV